MQKLILLFCLLIGNQAWSQISVIAGYNAVPFKEKRLDEIVLRYNSTRTWLSEQMQDFHYLQGFRLGLGYTTPKGMIYTFSWESSGGSRKASGIQPNGLEGYRKVQIKQNSFMMGVSKKFRIADRLGLAPGLSLDLTGVIINTKSNSDVETLNLVDKLSVGAHLFTRVEYNLFGSFNMGIEPYYHLAPKVDLYPVEQALDAVNAGNFEPEDFKRSLDAFGFCTYVRYVF
jgi:hypothetical protein